MSARGLIVGSEHVVMQVMANHPSDHNVQSILAHAQVPRFQAGVMKPDKFRDELDKSEEGTKSRAVRTAIGAQDGVSGDAGHLDRFQECRCVRNRAVDFIRPRRCMRHGWI